MGVHSTTAPLEWRENGVEQGFNIALAKKVAKRTGSHLGFRRQTLQTLIADLQSDAPQIDFFTAVSPVGIPRQSGQSDPIYTTYAKAYTALDSPDINGWSDLTNKRVAIKSGSFVDVYIKDHSQLFTRVDVDLYETGFKLLESGDVDVVLAENMVARRLQPHYAKVRSASEPLIFGVYSYVTSPQNQALLSDINTTLRQLKHSGEYDDLVAHWFGTGREKIDLTAEHLRILKYAIVIASMSFAGLLYTVFVSVRLRHRSDALAKELRQRKAAEQALTQITNQFQMMLDEIPYGVYLFDSSQQQLWSNGQHEHLLHHEAVTDERSNPFVFDDRFAQAMRRKLEFSEVLQLDNEYWLLQIFPIAQQQAVVLVQEVTEQQRLQQAHEQASRLASLGELSAGVAHEINNPTGLILHSIALISDAMHDINPMLVKFAKTQPNSRIAGLELDDGLQELTVSVETVTDAARRIARIVKDLKQYASPSTKRVEQLVDLNVSVETALRLTHNMVKRFDVKTLYSDESAITPGDDAQLQQVFINLIQNACLAMETYGGHLAISVAVVGSQVEVVVEDDGIGMSKDTFHRIKEPFFTTRRETGGTGLGLSICNRILDEHQARWTIQSTEGQGTRISLYFKRGNAS
ncbi:hypothetical protein GCM10007894_20760 [Paraferrimonas haliotis]|uniref:histidine kinase n=1 Tax=Paraferrimonas haliotis TaxID=2013866 RepID=A0AA37TW25_9GAMM|nr:hypothetical protein GCM10007894_20760 [Paraferrimonas haliotis]